MAWWWGSPRRWQRGGRALRGSVEGVARSGSPARSGRGTTAARRRVSAWPATVSVDAGALGRSRWPAASARFPGFLGVRWSLVELQGWLLRWSRSCLSCKLGNDDPQRTSRQRDEGFEVEQFERALGENRVPFGTGVDSILDVVSLLKASLRRFLLH
uniref:Uncharacterized protein n=1 Tax=Oryza rufipogon TaxID=4529 RepID=A0A0E0PQC2_ORYRU